MTAETATVLISEGESYCMALIAARLEDDGKAVCVASPGKSFQAEWTPLFRGKRVVRCFDNDNPGRTATATVTAALKGSAREISAWFTKSYQKAKATFSPP